MRKNISYNTVAKLLFILCIFAIYSCATGTYLSREDVKGTDVTGVFTLILYGGTYQDDVKTIAILDKEGDSYEFEVYSPEYDYKIKKDVPAKEALKDAEKFVGFHPQFLHSRLSKIVDKEGTIIGYEVRPLYQPSTFLFADILDVNYQMKDSKVIVYLYIKPEVKEKKPFLFRLRK